MYDVIVIGGSFAGQAAALQLARARRTILLVDAGQPRNRFSAHAHGFLGQDGRPPLTLIEEARSQLLAYPTVQYANSAALEVARDSDGFHVAIADHAPATARRLILATGVVDQLPAIPGLRERWGEGVAHCPFCHGYEAADRRIGVLATAAGSLHQARMLPDWSADVTLLLQPGLALDEEARSALAARGVRIVETPVAEVVGSGRSVEAVRLADGALLPLDSLFVAPTPVLAAPFAEQLGCAVEAGPQGPLITTDLFKATTVPGVFAAGDAARQPHSISIAVADGAMAGIAAYQSLLH